MSRYRIPDFDKKNIMIDKIYYSDLKILNYLFFNKKENLVIFDPENITDIIEDDVIVIDFLGELEMFCNNALTSFVLVNLSNQPLSKYAGLETLEGIIDFSKFQTKDSTAYYFINNPDQSLRWLFPTKSTSACFLNLYNGSGMKAFAFKEVAKKLSAMGWMKPIASGKFSIFSKAKNINHHFGKIAFDDFAIFTGTVGDDRKMVAALSENKICKQFVKIPLTDSAEKLVKNEFQILDQLSEMNFKKLVVPKSQLTASGITVSNVQPKQSEKNTSFQDTHLKALAELYEVDAKEMRVINLPLWETIERGMQNLKQVNTTRNGLPIQKVKQLTELCQAIYNETKDGNEIVVGIGHGDFTPWNMYHANGKLHLYDWEMANTETPLLFDVFHYFFQKGILIERKNFKTIKSEIQEIMESADAQNIIQKYSIDWEKNYSIYLLYIVCYYLPKYAQQSRLHEQVNWLTDVWREAMTDVHKIEKRVKV